MKKLILILILCVSFTVQSHEQDPLQEVHPLNELYSYLLDYNDPDIQLSIPRFHIKSISETYKNKFKNALKKAINLNSTPFTIYQANIICHANTELTKFCHQNKIHDIHQKIDPENVYTHILNLHSDNDENNIKALENITNEFHANSFFHENTLILSDVIKEYYQLNPDKLIVEEPQDENFDLGFLKSQIQIFVNKGLVSKEDAEKTFTNQNINSLSLTMGMMMANVYPPSDSHLMSTCKQADVIGNCLIIAGLLKSDKATISHMISTGIIKSIYEFSNPELVQTTKTTYESRYKKMVCYGHWNDAILAMTLNEDLVKKFIINSKSHGELEAFKKHALEVYDIEKQNGFNPIFNPEDCE